jgi:tRNA 2-thiouridine synthesizing protein E
VSTLYDDEGFLIDWNTWNEGIAGEIAKKQFSIDLTEKHWKCIRFVREYYAKWSSLPMVKTIRETSGLTSDEFEGLFKKGAAGARGVLCKICGLPKILCIAAGC